MSRLSGTPKSELTISVKRFSSVGYPYGSSMRTVSYDASEEYIR
jgi:hypothetical protein